MKSKACGLIFIICCAGIALAGNTEADRLLSEGLGFFKDSRFREAIDKFSMIAQSSYLAEYHGIAYFMLGKSHLAMNNVKDASSNIEHYLLTFKDHAYYAEAYYLKGRILFLQGDLDNAILVSEDFIARYPTSPFVPNSYFLIGECLYNKGQLDRARQFYKHVIDKFPTSAKIEAAQYRASLIDFKNRESELLKLIKWGYEDSLQAIEEYKKRESTYEQAILAYQKKLSESGAGAVDQSKNLEVKLAERDLEIQSLKNENDELKKEAELLAEQLAAAKATGPAVTDELSESLLKKQEMLEMKERTLLVKEEYLKWLKTYLESK